MMVGFTRSLLNIFCWILVCYAVFVSSRSQVHVDKPCDDQTRSEGAPDRIKLGSPIYDISNLNQRKFTDIASKIKDVIDKIQPDENVVDKFVTGFRDIDMNYNLFHGIRNGMGDSPIRRPLLVTALSKIITIMKEVESIMCPLNSTVHDKTFGKIVSGINYFMKRFQTESRRLAKLPESERLVEAESLARKTQEGHLLKARIQELAGLYGATTSSGDDVAVLCAMADGTFTYVSRILFSLDLQSYLADSFFNTGDMEKYNEYFNLLLSNFRDVRNSLVGSDSDEPLIQNVLNNLQIDENSIEKSEAEKKLTKKMIALTQIKSEIERIELPLIVDVPEKLMGKPDFEDKPIKTPLGPWQDGANVTYALQYRQNGTYSRIGEWMDPITVSGEANPILRIRVHPKRFDRLVFRKFNNQKPQLVGVLEDKYQTEFRDVNRDLYEAAARFDKQSLDEAEILINNGADINAVFEGGRRAIHAAALSDNVQLAKKFLIRTGNLTDKESCVNAIDNEGYTPMHVASEAGNRRFIQLLLESEGDVNAKTYDKQWTPLHIAADRGFAPTLKTLLKSSAIDVNSQDIGGFTPLHRAVGGGIPVLEVLMADNRTNVQAASVVGLTPLMLAVIDGYVDITEALLGNEKVKPNSETAIKMTALTFTSLLGSADIAHKLLRNNDTNVSCKALEDWTPLHFAVALKNTDVIKTLLSKLINQTNELTSTRISSLHIAVVTDQDEIVKDLINHGALIDERTESGLAPLHLALLHKKFEIFNTLVDGGADIQAKTFDGSSLLHFAIANNKSDIIESLVEKGVDINAKNIITGESPLHTAARNGYLGVIQILVQHGADVNAKNNEGETPLHYVASSPDDRLDILNWLTINGADVDLTDYLGRTALHLAANNDNLAKVVNLIKKGANVDCKDNLGVTPLHMASQSGNVTLVEFLLDNRASVDSTDNEGRTALHQAVRNGHRDVVRTLLGKGAAADIKDDNFRTPLHLAIVHNNYYIFSILSQQLSSSAFTDFAKPYLNSPFHLAIVLGRNDMIKDMYGRTDLSVVKSLGQTAAAAGNLQELDRLCSYFDSDDLGRSLCVAAQYGHTDIVDKILNRGVSITGNWRNVNNIPICCVHGNLHMMEHLISKGADVNVTCSDGLTPLQRAANAGLTDIVKLILKHKYADSDSGNQQLLQEMVRSGRMDDVRTLVDHGLVINSTALGGIALIHIMAQSGTRNEFQDLVDRGKLDVKTKTLKGETPLHFAARGGKVDIINYISASSNANTDAVDNKGRTPLHWALEPFTITNGRHPLHSASGSSTDFNVFTTLIRHGANVNHKSLQGKTPLHIAVNRHGSLELIDFLISKNADVNAKDSDGNTPIFDAVRRGDIEIVKKLVEGGADLTALNNYGESPLHYVTAIPNSMNLYKSDNYNDHLYNAVNQPAMEMVNYLKTKGVKV